MLGAARLARARGSALGADVALHRRELPRPRQPPARAEPHAASAPSSRLSPARRARRAHRRRQEPRRRARVRRRRLPAARPQRVRLAATGLGTPRRPTLKEIPMHRSVRRCSSPLLAARRLAAPVHARRRPRAFVVTTDFSTGGLSAIEPRHAARVRAGRRRRSTPTRALRWYDGLLYVVNRFGQDNIQVIDPGARLRHDPPVLDRQRHRTRRTSRSSRRPRPT